MDEDKFKIILPESVKGLERETADKLTLRERFQKNKPKIYKAIELSVFILSLFVLAFYLFLGYIGNH
jgi:hypothetical protein